MYFIEITDKGKENGRVIWKCKCDCGNEILLEVRTIRHGDVKSCGCSGHERIGNQRNRKNNIVINGEIATIYDVRNNSCIIDKEDVEKINGLYWHKCQGKDDYWQHTSRKNGIIQMHRLIMNAKDGELVDHIFHNKDDNRKSQLRICNDQ